MCDPISHYIQQGVLVEAIKARQNHNEQAVAMILEANRQRRILRREQQLRSQQQQLLKLKYGTFQKHLYQQTPNLPFIWSSAIFICLFIYRGEWPEQTRAKVSVPFENETIGQWNGSGVHCKRRDFQTLEIGSGADPVETTVPRAGQLLFQFVDDRSHFPDDP